MFRSLVFATLLFGPLACGGSSSESAPDKDTTPKTEPATKDVAKSEQPHSSDAGHAPHGHDGSDHAGHDHSKHGQAGHDHSKHGHAGSDQAGSDQAKHDHAGGEHAGAEQAGDHAKHDHAGGEHAGHAHDQKNPEEKVAPLGHRFEDADKWAKRFDDPARDRWQKPTEVVKHMQIGEGMHVVDIGAGTGYFLPYLSKAVGAKGTVLGLDIEKDMVRYMNERAKREMLGNVSARVVGTTEPGLLADSIDRILIVDTWHHLPNRVPYAKKLAASLSKEGTLTIVDFTMKTKRGPRKSHRVSAATILSELKEVGLSAKLVKTKLPDQFIIIAKRAK